MSRFERPFKTRDKSRSRSKADGDDFQVQLSRVILAI